MRDPVSGREYPEALIKTAAEINAISYDALIEEIKRGRVVLLEDGKILKRGYTTGACATAASKAAALLYAGKEAKKKVIFAMPAKICDLLDIDAHDHFDLEFSTVAELVERLKVADDEQLMSFFQTLADDLARKNGADVYVFDNCGDTLGAFISDED